MLYSKLRAPLHVLLLPFRALLDEHVPLPEGPCGPVSPSTGYATHGQGYCCPIMVVCLQFTGFTENLQTRRRACEGRSILDTSSVLRSSECYREPRVLPRSMVLASFLSITQHISRMELFTVLTSVLLALGVPYAMAEHVKPPSTSDSFLYTTPAMYLWVSLCQTVTSRRPRHSPSLSSK